MEDVRGMGRVAEDVDAGLAGIVQEAECVVGSVPINEEKASPSGSLGLGMFIELLYPFDAYLTVRVALLRVPKATK